MAASRTIRGFNKRFTSVTPAEPKREPPIGSGIKALNFQVSSEPFPWGTPIDTGIQFASGSEAVACVAGDHAALAALALSEAEFPRLQCGSRPLGVRACGGGNSS